MFKVQTISIKYVNQITNILPQSANSKAKQQRNQSTLLLNK